MTSNDPQGASAHDASVSDPVAQDHEERLRRFESLTELSVSQLPMEELLDELLRRLRTLFAVDTSAVLLLEGSEFLVPIAACGIEEEVRQGVRIPIGRGFAGHVAAVGEPVVLTEVSSATVYNEILIRKGIQTLLGVPLFDGETVIGVLHIGALSERTFDEGDIAMLRFAADRVAAAITSRRADIDRAAAAALQQSLAPRQLPSLPGYQFAARYVPGSKYGVSGDWYDVFALPGGEFGIVIGDVMGHGLRAATIMGRIKSALRAYALDHADPAVVVHHLDRKLQHFEPGHICTLVYAVLDPATGLIRFTSAGHLPVAIVSPAAPPRLVGQKVGLPLGVDLTVARTTNLLTLEQDGLLCLFTDGLIDQRRTDLDDALAAIADILGNVRSTINRADSACAALMARMVGEKEVQDDVTILTAAR